MHEKAKVSTSPRGALRPTSLTDSPTSVDTPQRLRGFVQTSGLTECPPVTTEEPGRRLYIPGNELPGQECDFGSSHGDDLLRKKAQGVPRGVAVEIPKVIPVALVFRPTTWTEVHCRAAPRKDMTILFAVEFETQSRRIVNGTDKACVIRMHQSIVPASDDNLMNLLTKCSKRVSLALA